MKFARIVFLAAGIFGLSVLVPQYFLETKMGIDFPPAITHPEFYYGFIGVAVVWQVALIVLSGDPRRFRPMMIPAVLEKLSFAIPAIILYLQNRVPGITLAGGIVDLFLGALFLAAFVKTAEPDGASA